MADDVTASVDLEANLTKSEALAAALAEDDGSDVDLNSMFGDDSEDGGADSEKLGKREIRQSLGKRQAAEVDDEEDEIGEVEDPLAEAEETEEEPPADDFAEQLRQRAAQAGLDISKYPDPDTFLKSYAHLSSKIGEREQLAEYGRQLLEQPEAVLEHLMNHLGKKAAKAEEAPPPKVDPTPEWKEEWLDLLGPDGQPKEGADPKVIRKIAVFSEWAQKKQREFLLDPSKMLKPSLIPDVETTIQKRVEEALRKYDQERNQREQITGAVAQELAVARQYMSEDAPWVFKNGKDPSGGLTQAGEVYKKWVDAYETKGPNGQLRIPDLATRREAAKAKAFEELTAMARKQPTPKADAAKAALAKKTSRSGKPSAFPKGVPLEKALEMELMKLIR